MTAVAADIREFVQRKHHSATLDDTTDIFALGYVTSLFAMQLVMFIENHFGIRIPNEELTLDNLRTIAAMTDLVERRLTDFDRTAS